MPAPSEMIDRGIFSKRAQRIVSNAALYDLVQDMAAALDEQGRLIREMHAVIMREKVNDVELI